MEFVSDPPISLKIEKMRQRVRWRDPAIVQRGIDQTQLVIDDGVATEPDGCFSFMVLGDSGSGSHRGHNPQRQIAEMMLNHSQDCGFVLHTGDVVYLVGSSEYYYKNFISPYRELLVGGERPHQIAYDQMTFNLPFLPVPGNHDYYDLPLLYGVLAQTVLPLRYLLRSRIDLDVGWRGSSQGKVYAQAFLDYLLAHKGPALAEHLDRHYTAQNGTARCLRYQPGHFTRLPNRYYRFRYKGIDFFALDSNTFNEPAPLSQDAKGTAHRQKLEKQRAEVRQEQHELMQQSMQITPTQPDEAERLDDIRIKLEQLEEVEKDINKQLASGRERVIDTEQLNWLKQSLIESWSTEAVRGRVLFFHHPPYVTEATKWQQAQTLAVRHRLREVLDQVAAAVGELAQQRPLVDLVLNGHAHCLEYLRTGDTGHADSHIPWIVCGGSGYSLRRQRPEGPELTESFDNAEPVRPVAESLLFVGRNGSGSDRRRPYSCLRIDVHAGTPPKFVVQPLVAERYRHQWYEPVFKPFEL
ncbi:MAG: metallophosphoesterase [Synechococcales cyanobacterium M58_A2018_015]|nr:metallophosphoesterase [Synechococcales cyanobacterium M58_A2018_015]